MHAKEDRDDYIDDVTHVHSNSKLKKAVDIKPCIQIKFELYHSLSYGKIFKKKDHTCLYFARYFKNLFFLILDY